MNDRAAGFCAGIGAAGLLVVGARIGGPAVSAMVDVLFVTGSLAMVAIGALDWWYDHHA